MPEESPTQPQSGGQVYKLAKSEIQLEDLTLSKFKDNNLVADHSLRDIGQITLESRSGFEFGCLIVSLILLGGGGVGLWYFGGRSKLDWGWKGILFGVLAGLGVIGFLANFAGKNWFLVISMKTGVVEYPMKDDEVSTAAFLQEMREHALKAGLMVDFRKGPKGATKPL